MENRRDFFKAIGLFLTGVVGAKLATYVPKEKEEELLVSNQITIKDDKGNEYHPVIVSKTDKDKPVLNEGAGPFNSIYKRNPRKLNS